MEITQETRSASRPRDHHPHNAYQTSAARRYRERLARGVMMTLTVTLVGLLIVLCVALVYRSWPLLSTQSLPDLLTSQRWHPSRGEFGFAPFLAGSAVVTLVALGFAVIPAILSGIYLAEFMTLRVRRMLKPALDLLVGIPSVVYGLWGVLVIVPFVREIAGPWSDRTLGHIFPFFRQTNPSGYGILAAGFVLGVMVFPLIVAVTEEVMRSVPRDLREAALCLGATRWEATKLIVRRQVLGGILAAIVLGFSRAFGETLAVMMLIGNAVQMPGSLFDTAYTLPALIANNYGEMMSVPLYESALMTTALLLLAVVVGFNVLARVVIMRVQRAG